MFPRAADLCGPSVGPHDASASRCPLYLRMFSPKISRRGVAIVRNARLSTQVAEVSVFVWSRAVFSRGLWRHRESSLFFGDCFFRSHIDRRVETGVVSSSVDFNLRLAPS